jgi:hypothetical protein
MPPRWVSVTAVAVVAVTVVLTLLVRHVLH